MYLTEYLSEMWSLLLAGSTQGVFFWAAVYTCVVLLISVVYQIRTSLWPGVAGTLIKNDLQRFGAAEWDKSEDDYITETAYSYQVNGKEYKGHRLTAWTVVASHNFRFILKKQLSRIKKNQEGGVIVFYNPKKPEKSYLIKPEIAGIITTALLAVLPFLLYWIKYY
ncbi:DUF3592 domain-containing protein [Gracilimonas sediminicola]|uniref:DUF3592 domain-containing protein n=1 Tax=Gracilimonas sediminicola TaxID=2952158 RepID=A0A9X2L479_9BACT|nr:hypothetical protein [Gracilimonas sediminicola]MCP9291967.1 hypothetical protein [Gracilimonas sediminicola]